MPLVTRLATLAFLALVSTAAQATAEKNRWEIMFSTWDYDPRGTVTDQGDSTSGSVTYDVDSDLSMSSGSTGYQRYMWQHIGGSRHNVGFFNYDVESQGGCTADNTTRECTDNNSGGIIPPIGGATTTDVTATAEASAPTIAWWSRFTYKVLSFDLGLSASFVDGRVNVRTENDPVSDDEFSAVVPALYLGVNLKINQWLRLHIRGNGISSGNNSILATEYGLRAHSPKGKAGFGFELGHRSFDVKVDDTDNGDKVDIELKGNYMGVVFSF